MAQLRAVDSMNELDVAGMEHGIAHDRTGAQDDSWTVAAIWIVILAEDLVFAEHV